MSKTTKIALLTVCLVIALTCVFTACSSTKYTLTYDTVGGVIEGDNTVLFKEGGKVTPPTPSKGNFTFDGWYADSAYTQKFESFGKMPAGDVTVYAKWNSYTSGKIHFDSNGGTEVASVRGVTGQNVQVPQNPTKEGYKFAGWCEDKELTRLYAFSTYPDGEITLYAKWQQNTSQYAYVTFDVNGVTTEVAVQKGQPVQAPAAQQGQSCVWYNSESKNIEYNFDVPVIANTTLYGVLYTEGLVVKGNVVTAYNGTQSQVFIPQTNNGVYVTEIAPSVFADNHTVSSVYIPATVQTIGNYAFYNCEYLETVNLQSTVTSLGEFAFAGCKRLISDLDLTGLTAINPNTFANCKAVDSVIVADNLTEIGAYAFTDCKALAQVNIPNSVASIGEFAFANTALTTVHIPDSLTWLGQGAVKGCDIKDVTVGENSSFTVVDNTVYADGGKTLLLQFGTVDSLVLSSTVETVCAWAFSNATVVSLDASAIQATVLQKGALSGIEGLETLKVATFNPENQFLAYWFGASTAVENTTSSFYVPTTLKTVEFTEAQIVVPQYAFYGCKSLQSVVGFDDARLIAPYAYAYTDINKVTISALVLNVYATAFEGANNVVIEVAEDNEAYAMYDGALYTKDLSKLIFVPSGKTEISFAPQMTVIGQNAFSGSQVAEVVVPDTIQEIAFGAFEGAVSLQKLTVPFIGGGSANNQYMLYIFGSQVNYDPSTYAASISGDTYPMTLKEITLTNPVTKIPDVAFLYCKGLETLNNDAVVTEIGNYSFFNTGFTKVEIADSVTTIGMLAYAQSGKISEIVIGTGVTEIKQQAFAQLPSLNKVTFEEGENDLVIGAEAFIGTFDESSSGYTGRSYLGEIKLSNNVVSIGSMAFGFAGAYGTDTKNFSEFIVEFDVENSRLKTVDDMAFAYSAVEKILLPASIETVGALAFMNCQMLTTVQFGSVAFHANNLALVDDGAFANCILLKYVYIFKAVENVGQVPVFGQKVDPNTKDAPVFYGCESTVYVPKSCLEIYQEAWAAEENITIKGLGGM